MINISGAPPNAIIVPPPPDYYDNYSGPGNPACFLTFDNVNDWGGQSFTANQKYNFARVDLYIKKGSGSAVGNVFVELYGVDGNGHPDGPMLNSGIIPNADISEDYAWVTCYLSVMRLTPYIISPATKYCVVVRGLGFTLVHILYWQCGGDGSGLPNGDQEWSINGGATWSTDNSRDQLFRNYTSPYIDNYSGRTLSGGSMPLNSVNDWIGNSFTAQKSYTLKRLEMYFHKDVGDNVGNLKIGLFNLDIADHPDVFLVEGTIPDADVPEGVPAWVGSDVPDYDIVGDARYAVVLHGPSLNPSNLIRVMWEGWLGTSDFAGGDMEWTITGGMTWTTYTTQDVLFRCYP